MVFPHKEGAYAETYRVRDTSGKLRFLKLIYYSKFACVLAHGLRASHLSPVLLGMLLAVVLALLLVPGTLYEGQCTEH